MEMETPMDGDSNTKQYGERECSLMPHVSTTVVTQPVVFPPGFEPGTFRVLGERDNHYTTETAHPLGCLSTTVL